MPEAPNMNALTRTEVVYTDVCGKGDRPVCEKRVNEFTTKIGPDRLDEFPYVACRVASEFVLVEGTLHATYVAVCTGSRMAQFQESPVQPDPEPLPPDAVEDGRI